MVKKQAMACLQDYFPLLHVMLSQKYITLTLYAQNGALIVVYSFIRESCGNCGFLSPYSKEEQVVNNRSYTSFDDKDFFCGK